MNKLSSISIMLTLALTVQCHDLSGGLSGNQRAAEVSTHNFLIIIFTPQTKRQKLSTQHQEVEQSM
jgi:hypothetical protein